MVVSVVSFSAFWGGLLIVLLRYVYFTSWIGGLGRGVCGFVVCGLYSVGCRQTIVRWFAMVFVVVLLFDFFG